MNPGQLKKLPNSNKRTHNIGAPSALSRITTEFQSFSTLDHDIGAPSESRHWNHDIGSSRDVKKEERRKKAAGRKQEITNRQISRGKSCDRCMTLR